MTPATMTYKPILSVLYPTDLRDSGESAFAHALRVAVANRGLLWILRFDGSSLNSTQTSYSARVRQLLDQWAMSAVHGGESSSSARRFVFRELVISQNHKEFAFLQQRLGLDEIDLIVARAEERDDLMIRCSELIKPKDSQITHRATLFVPSGASRFVTKNAGAISLRRVLIPLAPGSNPSEGLRYLARLLSSLEQSGGFITLLYFGKPDSTPQIDPPYIHGWSWVIKSLPGLPASRTLQQAICMDADLIVLTTAKSTFDAAHALGAIPEEVIRKSTCPIMVIPINSG